MLSRDRRFWVGLANGLVFAVILWAVIVFGVARLLG